MADKDIQNVPFESTQMEQTVYTPYTTVNPEIGALLKNIGKGISTPPNSTEYNSTFGLGESQFDTEVPYESMESIDVIRGGRQPWYDQAANFLNQAAIGEVVGGTIMSIGALAEAFNPEFTQSLIEGSEQEFSNGLYELGESITDWTKDVTPIYQTGERFGDSGWWFGNGVSIASTLSMMIPGMGVAKGVGALGKLLKLGTTATKIASTGLGALTMRHAENFREANDVFESVYQMGIQSGNDEETSRKAASDAAALDYQANYANLGFDIIQMGAILRPFAGLTRNVGAISSNVGKAADEALAVSKYTPKSSMGRIINKIKDPARIGLSEWTEGIEEGVNTASQFEAIRQGAIDLGIQKDDKSTLLDRVGEYLGTAEMQDSMLWGFLGGMAFKGAAGALGFDENKGVNSRKLAEIASRGERLNHYSKVMKAINNNEVLTNDDGELISDFRNVNPDVKATLIKDTQEEMLKDLTFNAAKAGNIDVLLDQVKDSKFTDTLESMGVGSKEDIAKRIPEMVKKIEQYESIYKKNYLKFYESPINTRAKEILVDKYSNIESKLLQNNSDLTELKKDYSDLLYKDAWYQSQDRKFDVDTVIDSTSLRLAKISLQEALADKSLSEDNRKTAERALANIQKRIDSVKPIESPIDVSAIDNRILGNLSEQIVIDEYNKELANTLTELTKPENIVKEAKVIEKKLAEVPKKMAENKVAAESAKTVGERKDAKAKVEDFETTEIDNSPPVGDFVQPEEITPVAEESEGLPFDDGSLDDIMEQTTPKKLGEVVDVSRDKINKDWANEVERFNKYETIRLANYGINIDSPTSMQMEDGVYKEYVEDLAKINSKYEALLSQLPTEEEVDLAKVEDAVEKSTYEDGSNVDVDSKSIEIEEVSTVVDAVSLKRHEGVAINYQTTAFKVKDVPSLAKSTIDITDVNPDAIIASEWNQFAKGDNLILSLDRSFVGEVDQYVSDAPTSEIAAIEAERKRDIEENATGLSSARKGDKGIFWTQFKGSRQDSEVDQEVTVKSVSKYGVLFDTDSAKWKNFNDSWNYFKNLTREAEINAKYAAKVKALTNTPTNKTKRVLTSGTPLRIRKSFDEIFAEDRIDAPIKVQVERDGQLVTVGYLPRLAWLNSRDNTASENYENLSDTEAYPADVEVDRVRKIRELITTGNLDAQYTFKVKDKGLGKLAITTDRDADGKKVNKPVSEIMPRYITSKYFAGTVQPFTIFNKDFLINPDTSFGGMIAVTEETMEFLKEKGSGSVFMMIPTAVPGVFIPTPASTPYLSDNISTLLVDTIVASVTGSNPELLRKIADNYGISIDSRTKLKDFLSEYVYFTSVDKINVTSGDGRVRIAFDTKTSTILINNGDGRVADKITLNTAKSNPEQFNTKIAKFKQSLLNTKLSVRLSKINSIDNFSVPVVAENGDINFEDSTYNKFLADNIKTDLVEIVTKNDIPVYVIQPVITMQQSGETAEKPVETIEVGEEVIDVPEGFGEGFDNVGLEDTPISDELIGVEQAEAIKGLSSSFLVKDGDYVYTSERQRTIVQTISAGVYSQFLDSDKEGKKLPVNLAFANAKKKMQKQYDSTINFVANLKPASANSFINKEGSTIKWMKNHDNALFLKEEFERILKPEVWSQFEKQVVQDLKNLGIDVTSGTVEDFSSDEVKDIQEGLDEGVLEGNEGQFDKSYNDFATFQMDSKDTASWRVKIALSTIRSGKQNYLGLAEYLPFDTVFDDLQSILSGVDGTYSEYIETLNAVANTNPSKWYIKDVVKLLENSDTTWALKNNFISVMQRAHNEFMLVKWKRGENGWTLNTIDSNRNNVINKVIESWNENFKVSGKKSGYLIEEAGELKVNFEKTKLLLDEIKKISSFEEKKAFAFKLFDILGIDLPQAAIDGLFSSKPIKDLGVYTQGLKGSFDQQFSFTKDGTPNGLFSFIVTALTSVESTTDVTEDKLSINNPFTGENSEKSIKFLAALSAKYGLKLDTNTHRNVESKQIYDYSFYTPERLRIEKLNKNAGFRADLAKVPFAYHSRYLQLLNQGKTITYRNVDGLSQVQSSRKGITRSSMSGREQLLLAIANFQKHNIDAGYLGLTHSDKSITPIIEFEKLKFDLIIPEEFNGEVTAEMLPKVVRDNIKSLVLAEISRINSVKEAKANGATEETLGKQYYNGGELFYFFPQLNSIVGSNPALLNSIDLLTEYALTEVVDTVNKTISEFYSNGIVYQNKDNKKANNWFTAFKESYVKDKGWGRNPNEVGLTSTEVARLAAVAAADMDINYMIHNANMVMLVHGDPALAFKKGKEDITVEDYVNTTWVEYQKRLAKDAAPGALGHYEWNMVSGDNTYAGTPDYQVVFVNDITNPTETEGYITSIEAYTGSIDRTDAQEWTTAKEHLNVLMSYGRIPDVLYKSMMDKVTSAETSGTYDYNFTDEELSVILQPMKPVQVISKHIHSRSLLV